MKLPQAVDTERELLGILLFEPQRIAEVIGVLKPEDFYLDRHRHLFRFLVEEFHRGKVYSSHMLLDELRSRDLLDKCGGAAYLTKLVSSSGVDLEGCMRIIKDRSASRTIITTAQQALFRAASEEPRELITWIVNKLLGIEDSRNSMVRLEEKAKEVAEMWKAGDADGVSTGFSSLDRLVRGLKPGELIVVAGATSMGKSAFVQNLALFWAEKGLPTLILSLEMSAELWAERALSSIAGMGTYELRNNPARLDETVGMLEGLPVYIDDDPTLDLTKLRAKVLRCPAVCFVVIDYLQLMRPLRKRDSREREVAELAHGAKEIARDLNVAVVAVSQLSRSVDKREKEAHRPRLGDLRESGALEHDADLVLLLYRPEYYGITELDGQNVAGKAEVIVAKQRRGPTGSVWLRWEGEYSRFVELEGDDAPF